MIFKKIAGFFARLISTEYMVKPHMRRGDVTPTAEAYKTTTKIALPAVTEMVTMALMDMTAVIMVGRLGEWAITAVALTAQPRMIFFSILFALNIAVTAIVSRSKGAGDTEAARSCLRQSLLLVAVLGTLMSVLAVVLAHPMMRLAGAQPDTIGPAADYFRIAGFGIAFQTASGTICAAQRAIGNTKITMKVNIVAKVVQIAANFLLIEGRFFFPRMEVAGAGVAMLVVSIVSFALALASLLPKDAFLRIRWRDNWRPDFTMLKTIWRVASGSLLEQVGLRIGFFTYARVVADLGTLYFAAHTIAMQLMNLSFTFADGIGIATTSLVGQNLGKQRPDLSIMYGKLGLRLAFVAAAILSTTALFTRFQFPLLIANNPEPMVVQAAAGVILILVFVLPIQTTQLVMGGSLRGAGDTRFVAMTMMITVGFMRPAGAFLLAHVLGMGLAGAWYAIFIDQGARLIMLYTRFASGKWIRAKL